MPAPRHYRAALLAVLLLPPAGAGCHFLTDSCGPETRDVTASTSGGTGDPSGYAQVMLAQNRGKPGSLYWTAQDAFPPEGEAVPFPLRDHVLTARLLDREADMALLLELPVRPPEGSAGTGGDLSFAGAPIPFDQVFALVKAGRTVLELDTDIPDRERLLQGLDTVDFRDWRRLPCD